MNLKIILHFKLQTEQTKDHYDNTEMKNCLNVSSPIDYQDR